MAISHVEIPGTTPCQFCPQPISEFDFEQDVVEKVAGGFAHQACYDEQMGEQIDKQPIFSPARRRNTF